MPNLVIVALPAEDDIVNKISSEKVAHMTLLFLGDASQVPNLAPILDFVRHATNTSLSRFGMEVDHRGVLGVDQSDCLFFSKSKWSGFDEINLFRSNLLKQTDIRNAYDSTAQFPEWVPHMTLGYPEAPANPDTRDYPGINYVSFDRIAVWNQEFDGIEFPLKAYDSYVDVAMSSSQGEEAVRDILAHISEKPWSDYTKADYSIEQWHAACLIHLHSGDPTSKSQCKLPVKTPNGALNRNGVHAAAAALAGARSPLKASADQKAKAASALRGYYSQLNEELPSSLATHSASTQDEFSSRKDRQGVGDIPVAFLAHYGIKGMKWGIRKNVHPDIAHIPAGTRRAAKSDAAEHTRAAMFFGEGAGTRRKLIKARVEARKKKDPLYAEAFDHFVKMTNMDKRASQARRERRRKDNSKIAGRLLKDILLTQSGIEHYGVKGMHWGVRRENLGEVRTAARRRAGLAGPQEVKIKDKRKKIKTSGGQGHPAHEDAIAARTLGQRGKASGLKSLSNKELEQYAKRLQLEANVNRLNYGERSAGKKFVADLLNRNGKAALTTGTEQAASAGAKKAIGSKLGKKVAKKAATAVAIAAI